MFKIFQHLILQHIHYIPCEFGQCRAENIFWRASQTHDVCPADLTVSGRAILTALIQARIVGKGDTEAHVFLPLFYSENVKLSENMLFYIRI